MLGKIESITEQDKNFIKDKEMCGILNNFQAVSREEKPFDVATEEKMAHNKEFINKKWRNINI